MLDVELLPNEEGSTAEFDQVLAISDGDTVNFGSPTIPNAKVTAEIQKHYKDKKIIVFKYKAKNRYRRKRGHRQTYTRLRIQDIELNKPRAPRRRASAVASTEAEGGEGNS
ncbi:MAG: 50S ribosomal protein L21 [Chloroflexi bacterium]|nr:50S ribosomal protein L21 [Chloroflexota bacterium]